MWFIKYSYDCIEEICTRELDHANLGWGWLRDTCAMHGSPVPMEYNLLKPFTSAVTGASLANFISMLSLPPAILKTTLSSGETLTAPLSSGETLTTSLSSEEATSSATASSSGPSTTSTPTATVDAENADDDTTGMSTDVKVAVGIVVPLVVICGLAVFCHSRRRRQQAGDSKKSETPGQKPVAELETIEQQTPAARPPRNHLVELDGMELHPAKRVRRFSTGTKLGIIRDDDEFSDPRTFIDSPSDCNPARPSNPVGQALAHTTTAKLPAAPAPVSRGGGMQRLRAEIEQRTKKRVPPPALRVRKGREEETLRAEVRSMRAQIRGFTSSNEPEERRTSTSEQKGLPVSNRQN